MDDGRNTSIIQTQTIVSLSKVITSQAMQQCLKFIYTGTIDKECLELQVNFCISFQGQAGRNKDPKIIRKLSIIYKKLWIEWGEWIKIFKNRNLLFSNQHSDCFYDFQPKWQWWKPFYFQISFFSFSFLWPQFQFRLPSLVKIFSYFKFSFFKKFVEFSWKSMSFPGNRWIFQEKLSSFPNFSLNFH